ncbi:MAG: bifunctional aconitate hydratase 2/2-methylisocitrate dehydratase [Proteobacteria bacterium]|nr:bifunctional aconitate hydratase 2/2-methylisocitrate dehydratase [Pseudomonadota bacterium]
MLKPYRLEADRRQVASLPPLPLTPEQTKEAQRLLERGDAESPFLLNLISKRVESGVSKAAQVKAKWLYDVALGRVKVAILSPENAISMLRAMGGGYNVAALIELLSVEPLAACSAEALKGLIKIYSGFDRVALLAKTNVHAREVIASWAKAEWFTSSPPIPDSLELKIYKVDGEINTDDFSPGNQAQSRADIPLHATFFGSKRFPDGIATIAGWRVDNHQVAFAGDVVGTGSSRKSAVNSLLWHTGVDLPHVPNKRTGGVVFGGTIAPIFYATARDAGILAVECEVEKLATGDRVIFRPQDWTLSNQEGLVIPLQAAPLTLLEEYRAGGRLNLIIGQQLTRLACTFMGEPFPTIFQEISNPVAKPGQGYSLAQKIVGRACGVEGVLPGTVCEPKMTTVGSQDTTGPMTMQEIAELACLRFKTDLFMQSFCHTAAYPKASDFTRWQTMRETTVDCGGVALRPGDGVIHPWLNKMLLPDTVGTGGDSHTRFPLGISFPAGSGLVAFAAALGFMPMEMPPSVLVRFHGKRLPGITVRDMVNAIPYMAIKQGLLTVAKKGKKNIFAGAVLEIEGVDDLSVEETFELTDASAERSAAACAVSLPLATVTDNVRNNVALLLSLVAEGYGDSTCLRRRIADMEAWLADPHLLRRDAHAEFAAILDIDLAAITEPILACPNDPDDVRLLSEVAGTKIDEAFIGSCMTHLSHLQAAARLFAGEAYAEARLWVAPSTRMDRDAIGREGGMAIFAQVGGRVEIPGCSLCMGNQARVRPGTTVISTSTRNFDNRLGDGARVYLGSTELTAVSALKGALPTVREYFDFLAKKA